MEKIKLLIVDDSELLQKRLLEFFAEFDSVQVVGQELNVQGAINFLAQQQTDLVILDIRLPDGNGIDVLRHIKKNHSPTRVLVFTNYAEPDYRIRCMEEGADWFLEKSRESERLETIVEQLIFDRNNASAQ